MKNNLISFGCLLLLFCSCQQQVQKVQLYSLKMKEELSQGQRQYDTLRAAVRYERMRWYSPSYWLTVHKLHPEAEKTYVTTLQQYLTSSTPLTQSQVAPPSDTKPTVKQAAPAAKPVQQPLDTPIVHNHNPHPSGQNTSTPAASSKKQKNKKIKIKERYIDSDGIEHIVYED